MWNFQEVFLVILSLFPNLKLISTFFHETFLIYKFETFKNCKEVKHIDYDYCYNLHFFILCGIWSTVENYFKRIVRPLQKKSTPPFLLTPLHKIQKVQVPLPFLPTLKIFQASPAESWGRTLCNGIDAFYLVPNKTVNKIKLLMISAECILKHFAGIRVTH